MEPSTVNENKFKLANPCNKSNYFPKLDNEYIERGFGDIQIRNGMSLSEEYLLASTQGRIGEELVIDHLKVIPANNELSNISSQDSFALRQTQDVINETHPFGLRVWKPSLYRKERSIHQTASQDIREVTKTDISRMTSIFNIIYSFTFGLLLFLVAGFGGLLLSIFGLIQSGKTEYKDSYYELSCYLLWPFGKVIYINPDKEHQLLSDDNGQRSNYEAVRYGSNDTHLVFKRSRESLRENSNIFMSGNRTKCIQYLLYSWFVHIILLPLLYLVSIIFWVFVFTIPMSNTLWKLARYLRENECNLKYQVLDEFNIKYSYMALDEKPHILLCTFKSTAFYYYKYTVDGINVIVVNLLFSVVLAIFDYYVLRNYLNYSWWLTDSLSIFILCLLSIIPLSFYIGHSVASISIQTSMGLGAVINALFSSVVEVFLYCIALNYGDGYLVEGAIVGSILGAVLLLPGLAMCCGAIKKKLQKYNPASAGITSALLIFSSIVLCIPTTIYLLYGEHRILCEDVALDRTHCHLVLAPLDKNEFYRSIIQLTAQLSAMILFLAYATGLWFTLRTHASMIWELPFSKQSKNTASDILLGPLLTGIENTSMNGISDGDKPSASNWSKKKSVVILTVATICYAIIAEILIACLDSILKDFSNIDPKLLGLIIIALVPNTTEFFNAISFALHGNIALSMEIGSAYALQVCLLQIPALVLYSTIRLQYWDTDIVDIRKQSFPMIFPIWDIVSLLTSIFMFTYLFAEGDSNYFKGSVLILLYIIIIPGFYFQSIFDNKIDVS